MSLPQVVIVGRPNVGKSSLMNWLAHKRVSIVDPTAGVTRDRVTYILQHAGRYFELVDTGGIGIVDVEELRQEVERQIQTALERADVILFMVDGPAGITALDRQISQKLRRLPQPKILVINKCDSPKLDAEVAEFHALTSGPAVLISVKSQRHQQQLLQAILEALPPPTPTEQQEGRKLTEQTELKLAIVGRRNVGKSTFINQLAQTDRMIVSEIPGTTRDSVDVRFELDGKVLIAIDTPGVRKRKSLANDVEWYGLARAKRSIRRADVVLMFFDASQPISRVDKQLVSEIEQEYKPCVFVVNKWDLSADKNTQRWSEYLLTTFPDMRYVPVAFISAAQRRNIQKLINLAQSVFKQARQRVTTGVLNRVVREAVKKWPPPVRHNRSPRILYATQVGIEPPTIVLKVNDAELFDTAWKRYLSNYLREHLPFPEVPLKLYYRSRQPAGDGTYHALPETNMVQDISDELSAEEIEDVLDGPGDDLADEPL
ncbi:MAG: GTPase Der [Planctomycetaceae bacterium]|nr:MAG: GTPase Der [Planctomycetaceae bacterium]